MFRLLRRSLHAPSTVACSWNKYRPDSGAGDFLMRGQAWPIHRDLAILTLQIETASRPDCVDKFLFQKQRQQVL